MQTVSINLYFLNIKGEKYVYIRQNSFSQCVYTLTWKNWRKSNIFRFYGYLWGRGIPVSMAYLGGNEG